MPGDRPNPLRREADAFRIVVAFVAGAVVIVIAAALAGRTAAAIVALALIALGIVRGAAWLRGDRDGGEG